MFIRKSLLPAELKIPLIQGVAQHQKKPLYNSFQEQFLIIHKIVDNLVQNALISQSLTAHEGGWHILTTHPTNYTF